MAVESNAVVSYARVGNREDLNDVIYNISPIDFPIQTAIKKGKRATNKVVEWQEDSYATAATNARLEGDSVTIGSRSPTDRLKTYTQILDKTVAVSTTQMATNHAGMRSLLAYELRKMGYELRRDFEYALCRNQASRLGSLATARTMAGIESWITTNASRGTGGSGGGFASTTGVVSAPTDATATNQRAFTEGLMKTVLRSCWTEGGKPTLVVMGGFNKQAASDFNGIAAPQQQFPANPGNGTMLGIAGAVDFYKHDFGVVRFIPSHFSRDRTALVIDPRYWEICHLQPFSTKPLARLGHTERRLLFTEATIKCLKENASGVVADLTTS